MEREFHKWLMSQTAFPENVLVGIGNDAAVYSASPSRLSNVIATDTIAEGTHFERENTPLELIGRKALAVNLSDIAAMGAKPETAVLTFMLPSEFELKDAQALFHGIQKLATEHQVSIIGGDTNRWSGPLVVGATVTGSLPTDQKGFSIDGATDGDVIIVSGEFGGSIHGRHLTFAPRVELGLQLAENYQVKSATDASDSLALDLFAILSASKIGCELDLGSIPISTNVVTTDPENRLQHALTDGEDFELIVCVEPDEAERLLADQSIKVALNKIGTITNKHQQIRATVEGKPVVIEPKGYSH